ncbi:MAG: hypothetical protein IJZ35_00690 [Clostridia bacterium]|nr:hypothetical protein [Clostridia bacterium]
MEILKLILFFVFITVGASYCWGMRGTIIGGEKGAMLPGAFLGLLLALFSGSEFLQQNPHLLAGIGAVSMYCGGNMTYGETLSLSMASSPPPNMKKGLLALFIKGGIWFGLFGGYSSLYISVLSGYYSLLSVIIFFVLLPVSATVFFLIFNKPYKPQENRFPKIYFSITRRETWGGLLGMLIEIIIFALIFKDWSTLSMILGTFLSGGIGWVIGQIFQIYSKFPTKKGHILFGETNTNGLIDAWKVMECVLGAIGGLGTGLTFMLSENLFADKFLTLDTNGASSFISAGVSRALLAVYAIILLADCAQYFVYPSVNRKYYKKLLRMKLITKEGYELAIKNEKPHNTESVERYKKFCEKAEFAIYSVIPMMLCFFGSTDSAIALSFTVIILVLCQEVIEKLFKNNRNAYIWKIMFLLPAFVLTAVQFATSKPFNLRLTMFVYSFFYEAVFFILKFAEPEKTLAKATYKTVHGYFLICCLVMNISILAV